MKNNIVCELWAITGAYPRVGHLKGAPLMKALALNCKHETKLERLARNKHSSLLRKFINYGHKKFYNIRPRQGLNPRS